MPGKFKNCSFALAASGGVYEQVILPSETGLYVNPALAAISELNISLFLLVEKATLQSRIRSGYVER